MLVDRDQVVAGHGRQPDVAGLVLQHLVVDSLCLLVPVLALRHVAALDLDDAHLVLLVLHGGRLGAGEGLLGGGPVPHVCILSPSVVGLLVALPGVHMPGRVSKLTSHSGHVVKTFVLLLLAPLLLYLVAGQEIGGRGW